MFEVLPGGNVAINSTLSDEDIPDAQLHADPGTTREFYCSLHPTARFKISCCDPQYGAEEYINNQCCGCE